MQKLSADTDWTLLASGRRFDKARPRSAGPLDPDEVTYCRDNGIELSYDPIQIGLVPSHCGDDIAPPDTGRVWPELKNGSVKRAPSRKDWATLRARYTLRPWHHDDLPRFVAMLDNPKIWRYLPENHPDPLTQDLARDLIELSNQGDHHRVRAIELDGAIIGQVRLLFDQGGTRQDEAEISYWLGEDFWGRGIASDVVSLFTHACFQDFGELQSVYGRVHEHNHGSARVLEKADYSLDSKEAGEPSWLIFRTMRSDYIAG